MSLSPGTLIAHYRIVSMLGRGGMGEVYHAIDSNLGRPIALKVLSQNLIRSDAAVQRFIQEARAASALNHPNIITVYDIGRWEEDGDGGSRRTIHYIAMELVDGATLRTLVRDDTLSLRQRVDILSQIAAGLAKAHAAGIIHRDLKPDNVMVTTDGYAKVLDFGLAKLIEKERPSDGSSTSPQLTQVGAVLGTIGYMAPEQVEQRAVDHRSDVFSFGCIAYQAMTGKAPFERGSLVDTLHAIVHAEPPKLADLVPDAPSPLVEIIEQCLAKNPDDRPQSMKDICGSLQEIARATDPSSGIKLPTARRRFSVAAIVAAVLIALAAAGLVALVLHDREPAPFDAMKITRVASSGRSTVASISPDAKYIAYSVDEGGKQSLWIRHVASGNDIRIVPIADVHFVGAAFSPDGNYIYYCAADNRTDRGAVYQVPVIGGSPKRIVDDLHVRLAISPDGQRIAYTRTDRAGGRSVISTRKVDGSDERNVAVRKLPDTFTAVTWSPEGDALAYSYIDYGGGYHAVVGDIRLEDGRQRVLASPRWRIVDSLVWLPDRNALVVNAKDGTDTRNQLWLLEQRGGTRRITNDLSDYESASLTSDGTKLITLQRNQTSSIWIAPGGSEHNARQLAPGVDNLDGMHGLVCLPDGRIVYASSSNDTRDLWIVNRDGTNRTRVTDGGSDILPSASKDGKVVVFMSLRSGRSNVWKLDVTTRAATRLTDGDFESSPSVAPDGTWFAFHSNRAGARTIWRMPITGGAAQQVTTTASSWASISPDGTRIACSWFDAVTRRIGIAVVPSTGGAPTHFFDIPVNAWMGANNHHVRWRDGGLSYVATTNGVSNVFLQPLDGSAPRALTSFKEGQIFYFDWSADGRDLVASRGSVTSNVVMIDGFR